MNYYQHHIGDYRRDTAHLSLLEHGIYRQLLDTYYLSEQPIPEETEAVCRRLSAKSDEERKAVESVLKDFFFFENGWHHKRCDEEIRQYQKKADQARQAGKLGGRPKKTEAVISDNREETGSQANHKPITNNQEPLTKEKTIMSGKPDDRPPKQNFQEPAKRVIAFLNQKTGKAFQPVPANLSMVAARLKEGATEQDCKSVIAKKTREWIGDEKMSKYLRPETLFNATKFAGYVGELVEPANPWDGAK